MSNTHNHIGEAIRARREVLGLTQTELCERMGWVPQRKADVSRMENGGMRNPSLRQLLDYCRGLDCHIADLTMMLNAQEAV